MCPETNWTLKTSFSLFPAKNKQSRHLNHYFRSILIKVNGHNVL